MHSTNSFLQISCKKKNDSISKGTTKKKYRGAKTKLLIMVSEIM